MCHYHHSLPIDASIMVSKNCPITGEHFVIISARWIFFLLWNFDKQNEMQLLAKFKRILYVGFRATLNFRKFKVVLIPMNRIALNVSLNLSIYYSFRHVLKPRGYYTFSGNLVWKRWEKQQVFFEPRKIKQEEELCQENIHQWWNIDD